MSKWIYYIIFCVGSLAARGESVGIAELKCEQLSNPQGIDARKPRLSWQITGEGHGLMQTAYQVMVASSAEQLSGGKADLWNSGKVVSDQSILVSYGGAMLKSNTACYWKVKVWTTAGESEWSAVASWSMGLLHAADWKAKWVGYDQGFAWDSISKFSRLSARYFRRSFRAAGSVRRAMVYIIGLGHYELYVNGAAAGDQVLAEAPTDYTRSVLYNTFDVTKECRKGENVLGVVLGNGRFFTMRPKYKPKKIKEFGFPKLLLQLEIQYTDGSRERIVSDEHWRFTADGPIRTNNEYDGEEYDATKELTGWNRSGYDDSRWLRPQLVEAPGGSIKAQMNPPIKVMAVVRPVAIKELPTGAWILDMGQNMAGWVDMKVRGPRGQRIVLRYAETLQKDGTLYTANLRDAKVTDSYTEKGEGEEEWHPIFVFHGFRYVEIGGYPGKPSLSDFEGKVVYDDMMTLGRFAVSDGLVNHIYRNARWGIAANYKGMPLDCPQRNERMPWLGDRASGSLGESYIFDNGAFYAKWLNDIEDAQRPDGSIPDVAPAYWNYYSDNMTWPGTYILVADMLYRQFGDLQPVERHYASMKKWLYYMKGKYGADGIMTKDKYGDWCVPPESPELIHAKDTTRITEGALIATAYYYKLLMLMDRFAKVLHHPEDDWEKEAHAVKDAFNRRWFNKTEGMYGNNTVTANLLPLYFGMAPDTGRVFAHIVRKIGQDNNGHISTGVIGTQWLMRGLTRYGRPDLAWKLATNKDYPGWGYMVERGATTIWELWNGDSANPAMNSHNHIMLLGDLITWMYEDVAGISPGEPGFRTIVMRPAVGMAGQVDAAYRTPYGVVKSKWEKKDGRFTWDIAVPGNTRAVVYFPDGKVEKVGSGEYHFEMEQ